MHLGSLESPQETKVALGYHLEQLLRFFCALQTSRVHPQLDRYTQAKHEPILNLQLKMTQECRSMFCKLKAVVSLLRVIDTLLSLRPSRINNILLRLSIYENLF